MVSINPRLVPQTKLTLPQGNVVDKKTGDDGVKAPNTNGASYKPGVPVSNINSDLLLINNGINIVTPDKPSLKPTGYHQFDSYEEFLKYKENVGFEKGDTVAIFTGKYEHGQKVFDSYKIGNKGTMKPCSTHIYDKGEMEKFKKALDEGIFKEGDTIIVEGEHNLHTCYKYTDGKLVVDSIYYGRGERHARR